MRPSPVIYSTFSSDGIRELILPHYDLGKSVECTLFHRGLNDTYLVSAPNGKFGLRVYRSKWRTRAAIMAELLALQHLDSRGVSVATPLKRSDGELITDVDAPEGVRSAAVFHWASGVEARYINATHAEQYGRLAAQLHNAGDDLPSSAARPALDMNYLLERPLTFLRPALKSHRSQAARLDALVERLRSRLKEVRGQMFDWGFCHGDLHGGNVHVDGDRLTLFDFDCCGPGWRAFDLATYRWAARIRQVEEQAWKPFIEGYLRVRPAAANSVEVVPLFIMLRQIWLTGLHVSNSRETGAGRQTDGFFEHLVAFCEKIEAEESAARS